MPILVLLKSEILEAVIFQKNSKIVNMNGGGLGIRTLDTL